MNLQLNKNAFFPTNIYECTVQDDYCDTIIDIVENDKDTWSKNLVNVNALTTGWDGLRYPILREIGNFACDKILPAIGKSENWTYNNWQTQETWINFYRSKDYAVPHTHFFTDFSAILIVKEGQGNLKFCSLKDVIGAKKKFEVETHEKINERRGSFIFFPSWLTHYVSDVNTDRITVAFNFNNSAIT
tara:strand:+ start:5123 stop:5686 length:564 start_codon:yes stop_codon:yes gene_type:complete